VREVAIVGWVLFGLQDDGVVEAMEANRKAIVMRREFEKKNENYQVGQRVREIVPEMMNRKSRFSHRKEVQKVNLGLSKFPTTTLGSYPVRRSFVYIFMQILIPFVANERNPKSACLCWKR